MICAKSSSTYFAWSSCLTNLSASDISTFDGMSSYYQDGSRDEVCWEGLMNVVCRTIERSVFRVKIVRVCCVSAMRDRASDINDELDTSIWRRRLLVRTATFIMNYNTWEDLEIFRTSLILTISIESNFNVVRDVFSNANFSSNT